MISAKTIYFAKNTNFCIGTCIDDSLYNINEYSFWTFRLVTDSVPVEKWPKVIEDFETQQPYLEEVTDKRIEDAPGEPTNLIIEGDNFEALSILNWLTACSSRKCKSPRLNLQVLADALLKER